MTFGELIRNWRKARKLGLVEVANAVGIDAGTISRMETGKRYPPDVPGIIRFADALGIDESSDDFAELLAAADRANNPELHRMALEMRGGKQWNPFSADLMNELPPVFCESLGELVSKATERAITTGAVSITVKSEDGAVQKFQVLHGQKRKKEVKRR
jgi:transcriptional regulator with XRE-family HTH domain